MASNSSAATRWIVGFGSLALALLFLTLGSRALQEREALWQLQLASQSELQQLALLSTRQRQAAQAQLLGETLAADAWVVELVRQAHALEPADPALTSIRNQLYTRLVPRWRNLQPSHPFRLLVHLAPAGEVFLRVHAPERHGDNLSDRHPILRDVLRSGTSRAGLDLSLQGLGMRAVTPLRVDSLAGPLTVGAIEVVYEVLGELRQLDRELEAGVALLEAGQDLGESKLRTFWRVTLPLSMPGVIAAVLIVFIPTVGDYVTPELIGGGKVPMIANMIESQLLKQRDQALGSALSVTVMMIVAVVSIIFLLLNRRFLGGQK